MRSFLRQIFAQKSDAEKLRKAVIKGDIAMIEKSLAKGESAVDLYMEIKKTGRGHDRSIDFLEEYIEDSAKIPGSHVPRHADWRIKRK